MKLSSKILHVMNFPKKLRSSVSLAIVVAAQLMLASFAQAGMLAIPNGDFGIQDNNEIPDFTASGPIGSGDYTAGQGTIYGNNSPGSNGAGFETSGTLATISINTTYTFSINIATADPTASNFYYIQNGKANMALLANGVAITEATASNLGATASPTYTTYTVSFNTLGGTNAGLVGENLAVQFGLDAYYAVGSSGGGGYPNVFFQNATLDGTTANVPEPSTWMVVMLGGAGIFAFFRAPRRVS